MTDLRDVIRRGVGTAPRPLDLAGVVSRSRQLSHRRLATRVVSVTLLLGLAAFGAAGLLRDPDREVLLPSNPTAGPSPAGAVRTVNVVFSGGCADLQAVERTISADEEPIAATLRQLFGGPTDAERARGVTSMFNATTAGLLHSVRVANKRFYVDLDASIAARLPLGIPPGCDRSAFTEQVGVTLQDFPHLAPVVFSLDGDEGAFTASPSPAAAAAFDPDCSDRPVRPTQIVIACADAGLRAESLRWTSWGRDTADATGVLIQNDCTPTCVGGTAHSYPATFHFYDVRQGRFTTVDITFRSGGGPDGRTAETAYL
jgi:hypothetical protein